MAPKGLKAAGKNKRTATAAFDPTAGTSAATTANDSTAQPADVEGRTMPLDGDRLSVSDLFELKASATSLLASGDEDKIEEARGLLRGILHGAQDLLPLIPLEHQPYSKEDDDGDNEQEQDETKDDGEEVKKLSDDELSSLQLIPGDDLYFKEGAYFQLCYIQGWALHEYGLVLPPVQSLAQAKINADSSGQKKRKVDLAEPRKASEWLDMAVAKYQDGLNYLECSNSNAFKLLTLADMARATADRASIALKADDLATASMSVRDSLDQLKMSISEFELGDLEKDETRLLMEERGDVVTAILRALTALIAVYEAVAETVKLDTIAESCDHLAELLANFKEGHDEWITAEMGMQWCFDLAIARADVALALFVVDVEAIERKYRPDAAEDEEGEVEPLPSDAKDVIKAKKKGENAISKLKESIELHSGLPARKQAPAIRTEQYQKLEEAYLMYSALFNPDEEAKAKEIEDAIAKVRKDGELEEDGDEVKAA